MAGQFHAPSHPGVLKKLNNEWQYTSDIFFTLEFLGVPIIVANIHGRKMFISS